ncbi:MAG: SDR family NAD(P)-dependent oxidoreductase [Pseudomonadota bacterium]
MRLKDRVAIVTGGGRGIGKAISKAFASEGARVVIAGPVPSESEKTVEEITSRGGWAMAVKTDIREEDQIRRAVAESVKACGRIDILVNNSGVGGPTAPVVDMDLEKWNEVLSIDLTGGMLFSREVLKVMIPQKRGNIIYMAAEGGRAGDGRGGYPMRSAYCCAKMGVIGLTETLAIEVGQHSIRVNAISPAAVKGERMMEVARAKSKATGIPLDELINGKFKVYSLMRPTEEFEVAAAAVFLASDESSAVTGQTLIVNCGHHVLF